MRSTSRLLLAIVSVIAMVVPLVYVLILLGNTQVITIGQSFLQNRPEGVFRVVLIAVFLLLVLFCLASLIYAIFGARMRKSRAKSNDIGMIDIGVGALENIALNAAKAAQAGIKAAKARVYAAPDDQVEIELVVVLYSDVEIPLQMAKIQDRVKKDVEKYTGIGVHKVKVKVTRVELIGTKVER